jgi:hypothetical protein
VTRIGELRNLGPRMEAALAAVGIDSGEALDRVGPEEAYRRLVAAGVGKFNVVALWAMEGALLELPWNGLPPGRAEELRELAAAIAAEVSGQGDSSAATSGARAPAASRRSPRGRAPRPGRGAGP